MLVPESPHGQGEACAFLRQALVYRPRQRSPQVRMLRFQPHEPPFLLWAGKARRSMFRQLEIPGKMLTAERRHFTGFSQPLKTEETDRLQQAIATGVLVEMDQGFVHQLQQVLQDRFRREGFLSVLAEIHASTDAFRRLKLAFPGKDAEPPQDDSLWHGHQRRTPIDHDLGGLRTGEGGAITSSQEPEALVQPRRKECYLHSPYSSRGQFERQGNAIE